MVKTKHKPKTNQQTTKSWNTKQNQKVPENLYGWLFQIGVAVCPTLYGHVKDKAQNQKSETDEIVQVN